MGLFVDRNGRRKSPVTLLGFTMMLIFIVVYGVLFAVLAEPLYRWIAFESTVATVAVQSLIVAVVGTAVCCLAYLLPDKRIASFAFWGMLVMTALFYVLVLMLDAEQRPIMVQLLSIYCLAPAIVGNLIGQPIYFKVKGEAEEDDD